MPLYDPIDPWLNRHDPRICCQDSSGKIYYLRENEHLIFAVYFDNYDVTSLVEIIRENKGISNDFRRFIADVMAGFLKRPAKMKNKTTVRDFEIHHQIKILMRDDPTLKLSSNKKQSGAAAIVADQLPPLITEDTALHAYTRIQNHLKENEEASKKYFEEMETFFKKYPDKSFEEYQRQLANDLLVKK